VSDALFVGFINRQTLVPVSVYDASDDVHVIRVELLDVVGTIGRKVNQLLFFEPRGLACIDDVEVRILGFWLILERLNLPISVLSHA
jgi:hypothetical protein